MLTRSIRGLSAFTNGVGWGISLPQLSAPGGVAVTKYKITRPYKDDTVWDDFLLALPEKDQLATFTKEIPLFVRYLKLVTDKENRQEAFRNFYMRCKDGLVVESDVYLATDELLAVMWKNGYSEQERNAIQFTFPSDYKFHYPELAVLFDVTEEDAYKFCMRGRMEKSHIGELSFDKMKPKAFLRDHWLLYAGGWFLFKNYPFFNYAFFLKTWGFSVWFVSAWLLFSRAAHKVWRRNELLGQQRTAEQVMDGEDAIVASMRRFANDGKALDYLKSFKSEVQDTMALYRKAFAIQQQNIITERVVQQLDALARAEAAMGATLQDTLVKETVESFKTNFVKDTAIQKNALSYAIEALAGKKPTNDPVLGYFSNSINQATSYDSSKTKPNKEGTLAERLAYASQQTEEHFQKQFMVASTEAKEVQTLASKAKSSTGFNFDNLDQKDMSRLEELYQAINDRTGFVLPHEKMLNPLKASGAYAEVINKQVSEISKKIRNERLSAFAASF